MKKNYKKMLAETRFPYITERMKAHIIGKYKTERGAYNALVKLNEDESLRADYKMIQKATIDVEWKKSIYGLCPTATMNVWYIDGSHETFTERAGGSGYDKLSSVVSYVLNDCYGMTSQAYSMYCDNAEIPYGLYKNDLHIYPKFEYGVGINCYTCQGGVFDYLGFKCMHRSGKVWDYFELTPR